MQLGGPASKREPSVTAVRKRRNLVSNGMCSYGHHIGHSFAGHSQMALPSTGLREPRSALKSAHQARRVATCFAVDKSAYAVAHAQNTLPAIATRA
jgi:hypothetical protein